MAKLLACHLLRGAVLCGAALLVLTACYTETLPPADLITPDEDSAELFDPLNPGAFCTNAPPTPDGLTPETIPTLDGGTGRSFTDAVVIKGVFSRLDKLEQETAFLKRQLGAEGKDWLLEKNEFQVLDRRAFDVITIRILRDNSLASFYFDATEYYDSWQ